MNKLNEVQNFHDISSLDSIRKEALTGGDERAALKKAAEQFESIFMQMLFKSMRKANEAFKDKDSPYNANGVKFFEDMHDQQLSRELSNQGALGLADMIVDQLMPDTKKYMPAGVMRLNDANTVTQKPVVADKAANVSANLLPQSTASTISSTTKEPVQTTGEVYKSAKDFIEGVWDSAKESASKIGLNPAVMVAQAALETGWGKHVINKMDGNSSFNLFNIKADKSWQGDKAHKTTLEFEQGMPVKKFAAFRAYESVQDSFNDFVSFIKENPRYQNAMQQVGDAQSYLSELQNAGYATDPNYAKKIMNVLERPEFQGALGSMAIRGVK